MKYLALLITVIGLGACSATSDVIGKVGLEGTVFRGTATGYTDRTGTIKMSSADGTQCVGNFRYTGARTGHGRIQCSDGRRAIIQFNSITNLSGYGYGTTSDGEPVSFTYGLSEEESEQYFQPTPEKSASKKNSSGTGFFINGDGQILTNAHVIDECRAVRARMPEGVIYPSDVIASDVQNDLAVILVNRKIEDFAYFTQTTSYREGDTVVAFGFPLSGLLSSSGNLTTGHITSLSGLLNDSRNMQISVPVQPGNSGGPLLDSGGNVTGVVASKLNVIGVAKMTGDIPQNVNFAIKDVVVKAFLKAHGIKFFERKSSSKRSVAEVGRMARKWTVFIECVNE